MHDADSEHPFALRRLLPVPNIINNNLARRQTSMESLAKIYNLDYNPKNSNDVDFLNNFLFFNTKTIDHIYNVLNYKNNAITFFDIEFSEGEFIAKEVIRTTMLHINLNDAIPEFTLDQEGFLEKVYAFAGFKAILLQNHNDFSRRFYLLGDNEAGIKQFFNDDITHFFESNPYYHVESNGNGLLVFGKERLASTKEIKALFDFGKRLNDSINAKVQLYVSNNKVK